MNTVVSALPRLAARSLLPRTAASFAALAVCVGIHAQTALITDDFNGTAVNTSLWANGSTNSLGLTTFNSGAVTLDTNQETTARNALLSHQTDINPFAGALTITLNGLGLTGTPGTNPISLYALVGHLPTDTGGAATGALASTYSTGGGGYGGTGRTGGALGLSILQYNSTAQFQLQILDSGYVDGVGGYANPLGGNRVITAAPTDIVWTIDGANSTFTVTLTGATFTTGAEAGTNTITGSFTRFTEATLGDNDVSRFAIGSFNTGTGIVEGGAATFGNVAVMSAAIPEPSSTALLSAAVLGTFALVRRNRRR